MKANKTLKRYQECNRLEKFWRRRWYLVVPIYALWLFIKRSRVYEDEIQDDKVVSTGNYQIMSFNLCWSAALGTIQCDKMKYYFTSEEVFENIKNLPNKKNK